jgi:fluoroacetyl-CoA thioesterase
MQRVDLAPGLKGLLTHRVADADLATSWQNDVPVLATPILLWLCELACMRAVEGALDDGRMTLGYGHESKHLAATPKDWTVQIAAELRAIDGKILTFEISAHDGQDEVFLGRHTRAVVDRARFVANLTRKAASAKSLA